MGKLLISDELAEALRTAITKFYIGEAEAALRFISFGLLFIFLGYIAIGSEARVEGYLRRLKRGKKKDDPTLDDLPKTTWWRFQRHLYNWYRPAAYPLIAVGFVEIVSGCITYARSGLQTRLLIEEVNNYTQEFLNSYILTDPYRFLSFEKARISEILVYYIFMERIVLAAIVLSALGIFAGFLKHSLKSVYAVCVGILPQAIFLYFINASAQQKTQSYFNVLNTAE